MSGFDRDAGIGASEAGMALGVSRFGTRYDLWARKSHLAAPVVQTDRMRWGRLLESAIIDDWSSRHGARVLFRNRAADAKPSAVHKRLPYLYAHFDGAVPAFHALIEAKTSFGDGAAWGEPGTDEVPDDYFAQAQHQLMVAPAHYERVYLPVLRWRPPAVDYIVERDPAFIAEILQPALVEMWQRVQDHDPPPIEPGPGAEAYLRSRYPVATEPPMEATDDDVVLAMTYLSAQQQRKEAEERMEGAKLALRDRMGAAAVMTGPGVVVRWSNVAGTAYLDAEALAAAQPEITAAFTKRREPSRRFSVSPREP